MGRRDFITGGGSPIQQTDKASKDEKGFFSRGKKI